MTFVKVLLNILSRKVFTNFASIFTLKFIDSLSTSIERECKKKEKQNPRNFTV